MSDTKGASSVADKTITSNDIVAGMAKRYAAPEWAMFFNVANGTGWQGSRYADAIGMSLFPSRGLELHGFEFKVSKSDYRREAAQPEKAESIAAYCDRWWVVTPPGLLDGENLPPNWGWLAYDGRAFYTKQKAAKLEAKAIDRPMLAALLRRAHESNDRRLEVQVAEKTASVEAEIIKRVTREIESRTRRHAELQKAVEKFEQHAGFKIETWNGDDLGKAVAVVQSVGVTSTYQNAGDLSRRFRGIADQIDKALIDTGFAPATIITPDIAAE